MKPRIRISREEFTQLVDQALMLEPYSFDLHGPTGMCTLVFTDGPRGQRVVATDWGDSCTVNVSRWPEDAVHVLPEGLARDAVLERFREEYGALADEANAELDAIDRAEQAEQDLLDQEEGL